MKKFNKATAWALTAAMVVSSGSVSALAADSSAQEIADRSNTERVAGGSYDENSADGITINDSESGHEGIIVYNADYTISNATISLLTNADGSDTCDFSGVGSAVAVYGDDSDVLIENSTIKTAGVATMPIFADSGCIVTVENSKLYSYGGTLYNEYMNSPDQAVMVAPPWILGIMGTSRCTNLMGTNSTMNVFDSYTAAGAWAVLSTDAGSNMHLNMYNTTLELLNDDESDAAALQETEGTVTAEIYATLDNPYTTHYGSGYGTYAIGKAQEVFAGATVKVGTYATIFTGGTATFTNIVKGETYEVAQADGTTTEYTATKTKTSKVISDTFGFMFHQGTNTLTLENGTSVKSGYATFLMKTGSSNEAATVNVDNTSIDNGGVLVQLMDNDDATTGGMMSSDDPLNTNGGSMNFVPVHSENEGFNTAAADAGSATQDFTFTNGDYEGNIYNASGSDASTAGSLDASTLNVTLGEGATLEGAAASTAAIHVTYEGSKYIKNKLGGRALDADVDDVDAFVEKYQNTSFDITHYYDIGQVANLINENGGNDINMTLTDDAVWTVTDTSVINSLSISDDAKVVVKKGTELTVAGVTYGSSKKDIVLTKDSSIATPKTTTTDDASGDASSSSSDSSGHGGHSGQSDDYDPTAFGGEGGSGSGTAASTKEVLGSWSSGGDEDYIWNAALFITTASDEETTEDPTTDDSTTEDPTTGDSTDQNQGGSEEQQETVAVAVGDTVTVKNVVYKVTDVDAKTVQAVSATSDASGVLTIANKVTINDETYTVTAIAEKAFKNNKKITSVKVGKNVESIGAAAFQNCKNLSKIVVKDASTLQSVGKNALKNVKTGAVVKIQASSKKAYKSAKKLISASGNYKVTYKYVAK